MNSGGDESGITRKRYVFSKLVSSDVQFLIHNYIILAIGSITFSISKWDIVLAMVNISKWDFVLVVIGNNNRLSCSPKGPNPSAYAYQP